MRRAQRERARLDHARPRAGRRHCHLGYGRRRAGRVGDGIGFDAYALSNSQSKSPLRGRITKTGERARLACTHCTTR